MKTRTFAERAGSLAFIIFTIGALGVLVGLVTAMVLHPDAAGRATLVNWVAASLVVALLGAVLGSVADAAPVRKPATDAERLAHLRLPADAPRVPAQPARSIAATVAPSRPAASAFRPATARR